MPVSAFTWHRGYSHAFAVLALATPLVAWAAVRIHPATRPHWRGWLLLAFLALVTHPILDCFTVYGTQVLLPFSGSAGGLVDDLHHRPPVHRSPRRRGGGGARRAPQGPRAPAVQCLPRDRMAWLAGTVAIKTHVDRVAAESLPAAGVTRVLTTPSPLNAVLWRAVAMTGDGHFLEGYYSLLDAERRFSFVSRPDGHALLEPLRGEAPVARVMWFSRGFFAGRELESGEIVISDLRMGLEERFVFSFVVGRRTGQGDRAGAAAGRAVPRLSARRGGAPVGPHPRAFVPSRLHPGLLRRCRCDRAMVVGCDAKQHETGDTHVRRRHTP